MNPIYEGDKCQECDGIMRLPRVENCSCHLHAPCGPCTNNHLTCDKCGWVCEDEGREEMTFRSLGPISEVVAIHPSHTFDNGGRIHDWDYDARSGSTMVYSGYFEGEVSAQQIIDYFGDGTFGHRGPSFTNNTFRYTKITD